MEVKSVLKVNGEAKVYKYTSRERCYHYWPQIFYINKDDQKFKPINIECSYETRHGPLYLKICLVSYKRVYIYELNNTLQELDDPNYVHFKITFDLNEAMEKIEDVGKRNLYPKIFTAAATYIFTCWCQSSKCKCAGALDIHHYMLEKFTVVHPVNSKPISSSE